MAVGRCWHAAGQTIRGFRPLGERDVVLGGAGGLTEHQQVVLRSSGLTWLPPARARPADRVPIGSATLASCDPDYDVEGRMCDTLLALLESVAGLVSTPR